MKPLRKLIIFILTILSPHLTFSQNSELLDNANHIAQYTYTVQNDSIGSDSKRSYTMPLIIGDKVSKYEHFRYYELDSLLRIANHQEELVRNAYAKVRNQQTPGFFCKYRIIKNRTNDSILLYEGPVNLTDRVKVQENVKQTWHLINETEEVCGYSCQKATTHFKGRFYTAWYTTEIPINEGPYKFKGLPGLIVKIEDDQKQHCFELVSFNKTSKKIFNKSSTYRSVNMVDYYKVKKMENLSFIKIYNDPERFRTTGDVGELVARISRRNNFIERL